MRWVRLFLLLVTLVVLQTNDVNAFEALLRGDLDLGLSLAHLSNSGIGTINPGVETLGLTFAWRQPSVRRGGRGW